MAKNNCSGLVYVAGAHVMVFDFGPDGEPAKLGHFYSLANPHVCGGNRNIRSRSSLTILDSTPRSFEDAWAIAHCCPNSRHEYVSVETARTAVAIAVSSGAARAWRKSHGDFDCHGESKL